MFYFETITEKSKISITNLDFLEQIFMKFQKILNKENNLNSISNKVIS